MKNDRRIGAMMARNNRKDTPQDIAWRLGHYAVLEQVRLEREARPVTAENVDVELKWQTARIAELMKSRGLA